MGKRIRVRGVPRTEPNIRLYALALIELARQMQADQEEVNPSSDTDGKKAVGDTLEARDV